MAWTRILPSGKYQGCYRDAQGIERSAGTFTQHAEALRKAGAKEEEQRGALALDIDGGKITWEAWFELWMGSRMLAYATEDCYRSTAANHIIPEFGRTKLADFETLRISKWVKEMSRPPKRAKQKPKSPWVVRNALMLLKTSLNAAIEAKRLAVNPAKKVPYPDLPEGLERYLTPDEVEAITFYMDGKNALIVWMGVQTGLRFGELSGLHWNRLDLDRGMIRVIEQFNQKSRLIDVLKDKEGRTVPLPPDLVGMLRRTRTGAAANPISCSGVPGARCSSPTTGARARGRPRSAWPASPTGSGRTTCATPTLRG